MRPRKCRKLPGHGTGKAISGASVRKISWIIGLLLLALPSLSWAKGPDFKAGSLARITELYVMVWDLEDDVQADGLSVATIRTEVEQMLGRAGITVVTTRDYAYAMHTGNELPPSLVVDVHTMKMSATVYVANVELEVWEAATLASDPGVGIPQATTWRAPAVLSRVPRDQTADIYATIRDLTGKFLDDYWAAKLKEVAASPE